MIIPLQNRGLRRMGLGLVLFGFLALLLAFKNRAIPEVITVLGGLLLGLAGVIFYLQGCIALAEAKGRSNLTPVIVISAICLPLAIFVLPLVLFFALDDRTRSPSEAAKHCARRHRKRSSFLERIMRYRRNAVLGIYFGLAGIALSIYLVIFRVGIFFDHSNEIVLGMFIFLGGYSAVIFGCSSWLKAKALNEAIVLIGLLPLGILFIRFVRLIVIAVPAILPVSLTVTSILLIVVVWALPDQSGISMGRSSSNWSRVGLRWPQNPSASMAVRRSGPPPDPMASSGGRQDNSKPESINRPGSA